MALSFCSNWSSLVINPSTQTQAQAQAQTESDFLFGGDFYDQNFVLSDQLLDQQLAADYDSNLLYPDLHPDNLVPLPEPFDSSYQYIKRRKSFEEYWYPNSRGANVNVNVPCFVDGFDLIPAAPTPEFLPCSLIQRAGYGEEEEEEEEKKRSVSPQSMAARQRRKKITDKTHELGKLVPGGTKMNTADMFNAASKYVKWLQAQVAILHLMSSVQEAEEITELKVLLGTSVIQEKLYSEEKCLVPLKFVQDMASDKDIQSKPWIVKDIDRLLQNKA